MIITAAKVFLSVATFLVNVEATSLNGEVVTTIDSKAFYHGFLKAWIGDHPFNSKIKDALLGR